MNSVEDAQTAALVKGKRKLEEKLNRLNENIEKHAKSKAKASSSQLQMSNTEVLPRKSGRTRSTPAPSVVDGGDSGAGSFLKDELSDDSDGEYKPCPAEKEADSSDADHKKATPKQPSRTMSSSRGVSDVSGYRKEYCSSPGQGIPPLPYGRGTFPARGHREQGFYADPRFYQYPPSPYYNYHRGHEEYERHLRNEPFVRHPSSSGFYTSEEASPALKQDSPWSKQGNLKPRVWLNDQGFVDSSCQGKNMWHQRLRAQVLRTLDVSIFDFSRQIPGDVEHIIQDQKRSFEYVENGVPIQDACIRDYARKILKTERNSLKKKWEEGGGGWKQRPPFGVDHGQWVELIKYWTSPSLKSKSEQLSMARACVQNLSHAGRGGNAQIAAKLNKACEESPTRDEIQTEGCTPKGEGQSQPQLRSMTSRIGCMESMLVSMEKNIRVFREQQDKNFTLLMEAVAKLSEGRSGQQEERAKIITKVPKDTVCAHALAEGEATMADLSLPKESGGRTTRSAAKLAARLSEHIATEIPLQQSTEKVANEECGVQNKSSSTVLNASGHDQVSVQIKLQPKAQAVNPANEQTGRARGSTMKAGAQNDEGSKEHDEEKSEAVGPDGAGQDSRVAVKKSVSTATVRQDFVEKVAMEVGAETPGQRKRGAGRGKAVKESPKKPKISKLPEAEEVFVTLLHPNCNGRAIVGHGWVRSQNGVPIRGTWNGKDTPDGLIVVSVGSVVDEGCPLVVPNLKDDPPQIRLGQAKRATVLWLKKYVDVTSTSRQVVGSLF